MEGSVLSFFKAEWKVGDTGSVYWASSLIAPSGFSNVYFQIVEKKIVLLNYVAFYYSVIVIGAL